MFQRVIHTVRVALRALGRAPGYVVSTTLAVGLGVGATTAIFTLVDWALMRPVPGVERPDELMALIPRPADDPGGYAPLSNPVLQRLQAAGGDLAPVVAYSGFAADIVVEDGSEPVRARGQVVTPGFFDVLGVSLLRGRSFSRRDGGPTTDDPVVIVGYDFWQGALGGGEWVGRSLTVNNARLEVVGIASAAFRGPSRTDDIQLWVPSSSMPAVMPRLPPNVLEIPAAPVWTHFFTRPPPGSSARSILEQLEIRAPGLAQDGVLLELHEHFGMGPSLRAHLRETLTTVAILVGLLLALTVASLVNLTLARLVRRRSETVLRRALGATRLRALETPATEVALLAIGGSAMAFVVATALLRGLEGAQLLLSTPDVRDVPIDLRTLAFALLATLVALGLGASLAALGQGRLRGTELLRTTSGGTIGGQRLRLGLVGAQAALSLALVAGAGLLARSIESLRGPAVGFDPSGVVMFSLNPGVQGRSDEEADAIFRELAGNMEDVPEVEAAGFAWLAPLGARRYPERVVDPGTGEEITVDANMVSPGFFRALDIDVLEGRTFDQREYAREVRPDRGAIVMNRALAERLFAGVSAVGREVVLPGRQESAFEVIGVVDDARLNDLRNEATPALFDPFGNGYRTTSATFIARASRDPATVLTRLRAMVRERHPDLTVADAGLLEHIMEATLTEERTLTRLVAAFAALALVLAGVGMFGLMATVIQSRVPELGIRSALGAGWHRLAAVTLVAALKVLVVGVLLGVPLAWGVGRLLQSRLHGVGALEPSVLLSATGILMGASLAASLPWAVRAARTDPARALSAE